MVERRELPEERLAPLSDDDWPPEIGDMRSGFAGGLNVYRTMAHHAGLLRAWTGLREHIVRHTALGPVNAEIAILRTGVRLGSDYEWSHHVSRARALGVDDGRIARLRGPADTLEGDDGLIARAVDELVDQARLEPTTLQALTLLAGKEGVLDLMATVGMYSTLAFLTNTFEIPVDDAVALELRKKPL